MNNTTIEFTQEKIHLNCNGKMSSYKQSSKNPIKSMIARIIKITGLDRKEVSKFVKQAFYDAKPTVNAVKAIEDIIDKKVEEKFKELYKRIDEKFQEQNKQMETLILRLIPSVGMRPESVTSSDEETLKEENLSSSNGELDIGEIKQEEDAVKKNQVIDYPQVLLGATQVKCDYDIETGKLYHSRKGKEIGSVEYLTIDDDAFNYDNYLSKGEINDEGICVDIETREPILLFTVDLDKISMDELGEYHQKFRENPHYCRYNVEADCRYIDYIELGCNWEGFLYHCGQRDDFITFVE